MYKVQTLNKISDKGLALLDDQYELVNNSENVDAILVRSTKMHDIIFPSTLKAIARAGAGVNNIPIEECTQKGIVVFNTPGANANAVKELVIAGLFLASRKIVEGINWTKTLEKEVASEVEKGKSNFVGPEILGKKIGVIGLGAIGVLVANAAQSLGMEVIGYDPYISINAAWGLSRHIKHATCLDEVLGDADYLTVHVPLVDNTKYMFNKETFNKMKPGVRLLNFSRDKLVHCGDLLEAIEDQKIATYVTDFPVEELLHNEKIILIPHLGASTPESEENCAIMAVKEIKDYLENGNIINSVNFPECSMVWSSKYRLTIIHKNIPAMLGKITAIIAREGINIQNMSNRSLGEWAYTLIDTDTHVSEHHIYAIKAIENVIQVRFLVK